MRTMMKGAAFAALLAAGTASPVLAQAAGGVLTIDLDRVYTESAAAKSAQAQLVARYDAPSRQANTAFETARTSYATQVQAAQRLLGPNGDASKLPPATQQSLGAAQQRLEEARNQGLALQQSVQDSQAYVRDQIIAAVLPIAEQVRAERKAALITPRGSVLAADPASDMTAVILPRLDARLATVQITRPAPAGTPPAATTATPPRPTPQGR